MIKFFRKIRQNLLTENKFSKYLLYAIGEIVLVVIGILIALQINNWNENRKDRQQERVLLKQLQSEFQSNLEQLDQKIQLRKSMVKGAIKLLNYIDHPEQRNPDSVLYYIPVTQLNPTFDPIVNDLVSTDRIQLIRNQNLKEKLSSWTSEIVQVTEEEVVWVNFRANSYRPYLFEKIPMRSITNQFWKSQLIKTFHLDNDVETNFILGDSQKEINVDELLDDVKFEGYMAECASVAEALNSQSYSLRERIVEILTIINSELQKSL
ncbi:DUF6090 family protein [Muriicola sp.]|uniref:DUF6090 family protein n=1 Tax=Muriicola sp. TaxID=2020856 RepID=UPI003C72C0B5